MQRAEKPPVDARCAIILLLTSNIVAFTQQSIYVEAGYFATLFLLLVYCKCATQAVKWLISFIIAVSIQYLILPQIPQFFMTAFSILVVYFRKMLPCLMVGTIIVKKIPMQYMILAGRKWRVPQSIIIPLTVTIRYIPSLIQDFKHVKDSLKLRQISGVNKIECFIVPIIMSATNTSEELSQAAVTRGVENPCQKTSFVSMSFKAVDYISVIVCLSFVVLSILSRGELF